MTNPPLVVGLPARGARDWSGRTAWGRDAHLLQGLMHRLGEAQLVVLPRARLRGRAARGPMILGAVVAKVVPHPMEVPGWTRHATPAAIARRAAARPPSDLPAAGDGLVMCFDVMRHEGARSLARARGLSLVTDLMDDWRRHDSMPAWRDHLTRDVFPELGGDGEVLTSVTALAASPRPAVIVPNAGFHEWDLVTAPAPGPKRPVAAFLGTIHGRIDCDLLIGTARRLPGWEVVVAGPVMDRAIARRLDAARIRRESWWEMDGLDRRATVAIAPYQRSHFTLSGDPLKVYETTARGVPCVSTVPIAAPPSAGLTVTDPADFADAVLDAASANREDVLLASRATGSWEDRADAVLGAIARAPVDSLQA